MGKSKDVEVKKGKPPVAREVYHPLSPFDEMERLMESMFRSRWPRLY